MRLKDYGIVAYKTLKAAAIAAKNALSVEVKAARDADLVRHSEFFDADWYLLNNPDVEASGMDPAVHYVRFGVAGNRNPSPYFINEEYYSLHNDVRASKMNPLVHFERFGKREGRSISVLEEHSPVFPEGAVEGMWRFERAARRHGRTAVVASYFGRGELPDALLYLLRGLREVVDNVVYVADCPVFAGEVEKLRGLVTVAKFERHGQYDFGSYRRGVEIARAEGLLPRLPPALRDLAEARLAAPEASLSELGARMSPPVSKSAVKYRWARLERLLGEPGIPSPTTIPAQKGSHPQ